MKCPHCKKEIPDEKIAKHLAGKGGRKSKRTITPEQQAKLQAARKRAKKAGWNNPWPESGEQCPECGHGLVEVQEFGQGKGLEIFASCVGLIGCTQEGAGCGWSGHYFPNKLLTDSAPER